MKITSRAAVDEFLSQRVLAVAGVSKNKKKFGNAIFRELRAKGYRLLPVNPNAADIDGEKCYSSLRELPEKVDGVIIVTPSAETEKVVNDAVASGIRRVWIQQGAETGEAIRLGREKGLSVVHGECILMFAEPAAFPHSAHRWIWRLLGKLPNS